MARLASLISLRKPHWAHDGRLWDWTIDFTQYAERIRAVHGPHSPLRDPAP